MFKGKFLAGILAASLSLFLLPYYFALSLPLHLCLAGLAFFFLLLSILVVNRRLPKKQKLTLAALGLVLLAASFAYSALHSASTVDAARTLADGKSHTVTATVMEIRYAKPYGSAFVLESSYIDGREASIGILIELDYDPALSVGDQITFSAPAAEVSGTYEYYHRSRGVLLEMRADELSRTAGKAPDPTLFERLRTYIKTNFETHIGGESAGYATALLTGDKSELDGYTSLHYQRLGISHVLAVSGMHFSVMIGGLDLLLRALLVKKKRRSILIIAFAVLFAGICGFSASILRALFMFCLLYLSDLLGERADAITSLFVSAFLIVMINPFAGYDAGFWLSFLSTLGILLVAPSMKGLIRLSKGEKIFIRLLKMLSRAILCMTVMNITALFFTLPVTYLLFGGISLISPLANLIFIPLTELILYLLILLTLIGPVPFLAPFLGSVCRTLIEAADALAGALSDIPNIFLSIRYPFALYILIALVILVAVTVFFGEMKLRRLFAVFLAATLVFSGSLMVYTTLRKNTSELYLCTDGKSDVIGVLDAGEAVLFDITTGGKAVPYDALEALLSYYSAEIDTYVLTHLHLHHAGMLESISQEMKLHRVLIPAPQTEKEISYAKAIESALSGEVELVYYDRESEIFTVGATEITLPSYTLLKRSVHPVITLSARVDGKEAWLYLGGSAMEFDSVRALVPAYRAVIFGAHDPDPKHIFDDELLAGAELVVLSSGAMEAYIDPEKLRGELVSADETYRIHIIN